MWAQQRHDIRLFVTKVDFHVTAKGKTIASNTLAHPPYQIAFEIEDEPTAFITVHLKDKVERITRKVTLTPPSPAEKQPVESVQVIETKVCLHAAYQLEDTTAKPVTAQKLLSLNGSPKRSNSNEHQGWVAEKQCSGCERPFTQLLRRHHCRRCKESVCSACSPHKLQSTDIVHYKKYVRVCNSCYKLESVRDENELTQSSKDAWLINNSAGGDLDVGAGLVPEPELEPDLEGAQGSRANPVWAAHSENCMLCMAKEEAIPGAAAEHCRYCGWTMCTRCGPPELTLEVDRWVSSVAGHPIKWGDRETIVEWKWADALTAGLSRLNPLRWSTGALEVMLEDLDRRAQAGGSEALRKSLAVFGPSSAFRFRAAMNVPTVGMACHAGPVQVRLKCGGALGQTLRGLLGFTLGGNLGGSVVAVGDSAAQIAHDVKGYLGVERRGLLGTEEDSNAMEQSFPNPAAAVAWLERLLSSDDAALLAALSSKSKRVCENCARHAPQEMRERLQAKHALRNTMSASRSSVSSNSSFNPDSEWPETSPREGTAGAEGDERVQGHDLAVRTRSGGLRTAISADLSDPTRPSPASQFSTAMLFTALRRTPITMNAEPDSEVIGVVEEGDVVEALRTLNDDIVGLRLHIGRGYVTVSGLDGDVNLRRAVGDDESPVPAEGGALRPPLPRSEQVLRVRFQIIRNARI